MSTTPDQTQPEHQVEQQVPDPRYEPTDAVGAESAGDVVDAWLRGLYPLGDDEDGVIRTEINYYAAQHDDGSGVFMSPRGTAVYAVRLADGTVIGNESRGTMWPWDATTQDVPSAYAEVPFRFVGHVATEQSDLNTVDPDSILARGLDDDETLVEGDDFMRELADADVLDADHAEEGVLLTHESGVQVYIGWDSTAYPDNDLFGFVPFDGTEGTPVPSAADALDLLKPFAAAAREDDMVTRQGEWFLVPTDDHPGSGPCKPGVGSRPYGGSPLESHVPREYALGVSAGTFLQRVHEAFDVPADIRNVQPFFDWLHAQDAASELFEEARDLAEGVYVRGTVRHRGNEHYLANVGEEWHRAVTHDREVMTTVGRQIMAD